MDWNRMDYMRETQRRVSHSRAGQLLHNKFVLVLGDSVQRGVYKDIVLVLQKDDYLTLAQLKTKGEVSFEGDHLVEGGRMGLMNNGTEYREVREFRSDHHLVRFHFLTRIYSPYMESILDDLRDDLLKPDVVIVNSCLWDISRYNPKWELDYKENLHTLFLKLTMVLPRECLLLWNMTMPLGKRITGGFLVPEIEHMGSTLRRDVIEANFYAGTLAAGYGADVLDLHFHFRLSLGLRMQDGVHWNALAHRHISCLLLLHLAQAWGVAMPPCPLPAVTERIDQIEQRHAYGSFAAAVAPSSQSYRPRCEAAESSSARDLYQDDLPSCPTFEAGYFTVIREMPVRTSSPFRPALPYCHIRPYDRAPPHPSSWPENPQVMRRRRNNRRDAPPYTRPAASNRPRHYFP